MTDTSDHSTLTSMAQLFGQNINGTHVDAIEIPLFQRDYAQGRKTEHARLVRERFIADLCAALDDGQSLHLDFVFGDVVNCTLYPLDGQQRLTTLFLLHCYLAWHQEEMSPQPWHAFHYATRPGARQFCAFLTQCRPDMGAEDVSGWLCDQAPYLPTWKHDPTIQGMLVVLDTFHKHYRGKPPERMQAAWQRLTDPEQPAISFLLLPVAAEKLDNTLYVKMNSRGRPLTEFENFKAELESLLHSNTAIASDATKSFCEKIDTDWTDLFWQYRRDKDLIEEEFIIDEEFMRFLRFLLEVRAWQRGHSVQSKDGDLQALLRLSELLLGSRATDAPKDFAWITWALDVWLEDEAPGRRKPKAISAWFAELITRQASGATTPLRIFNLKDFSEAPFGVDLFHACCELYGTGPWKLPHTLFFYGVLQGLMGGLSSADLHPRLRLLRNLIEGSEDEIRADDTRNNMPALLGEVEIIMSGGSLTDIKTFNKVQLRNEKAKRELLAQHPTLQQTLEHLEDHDLLRGGLSAFDLTPTQDAATFSQRTEEFYRLFGNSFEAVSAALLAKGHDGRIYHERQDGYRFAYLGACKPQQTGLWENHWRARSNEDPHPSSAALMALLDDMAMGQSPESVIDLFIKNPRTPKNWRYYLAKYRSMRSAQLEFAGNYVIAPEAGYAICIPKTRSCDNRSNHHDAYLLALAECAGLEAEHIANDGWPRCFPGYANETEARYLELRKSGLKVRCVDNGWVWDTTGLNDPAPLNAFEQIAGQYGTEAIPGSATAWLTKIAQQDGIDTEDRIAKGAALLKALINN